MSDNTNQILANAKDSLNTLFTNMFQLDDGDMAVYDACYSAVFSEGVNFSYMSATFYAQFAAEILVGALASNPFRRFITKALDDEKMRLGPGEYWEPSMLVKRFGLDGVDYTKDIEALTAMMNDSYIKIMALNNWYGTDSGKEEFEMHCLSNKAIRDIRRMVAEFPYLIRRYDFDRQFAGEIMEYAGIVANQIRDSSEE